MTTYSITYCNQAKTRWARITGREDALILETWAPNPERDFPHIPGKRKVRGYKTNRGAHRAAVRWVDEGLPA